jgi:threonine dehydrogenase-like Zn-dependent dehydrogenase
MRALVFDKSMPRLAATRVLAAFSPRAFVGPTAPIRMQDIPEPTIPADDWVRLRTRLCGICGSDTKQVFLNGALDNPMTALISFPQVLGHEVVATVEDAGPAAQWLVPGQRVVLNPWLSCGPRGLPPCDWCRSGDFAQCTGFAQGTIEPGIHTGNSSRATGGFAPLLPAHASMCIPVPDAVTDEAAVLADPFAVSFHSIVHSPPPPGGTVLVYGCGTLGLLAIAILHALHPDVRVLAVARYAHQADLAVKLGADRALPHRPTSALIDALAELTGSDLLRPWNGLPMLNGGVDVIYDTVGSPETLEVGVRVTRSRGRISVTGVEAPKRFEWTPLYFKELSVVGSNAFGHETWQGRRQHAMEWYFELIGSREFDATAILTHRFELANWRDAFMALWNQGRSGAVKVLFDYRSSS